MPRPPIDLPPSIHYRHIGLVIFNTSLVDGRAGVTAVGVCAHGLAELLVQRRATDQHDEVLAHALLFQGVDDDLHVGHGGGEQRRHAEDVRLVLFHGGQILLDRVVDAEVDHLEAGTFHHHADEVLADVVDVALDGADHHLALARGTRGDEQRTEDEHAGLHRVGRQQHFRNEKDAVAEVDADDAHAFDEGFGQDLVGGPATLQQDVNRRLDLFLEAVVKVVMDLLDQFLVIEGVQVKFTIIAH